MDGVDRKVLHPSQHFVRECLAECSGMGRAPHLVPALETGSSQLEHVRPAKMGDGALHCPPGSIGPHRETHRVAVIPGALVRVATCRASVLAGELAELPAPTASSAGGALGRRSATLRGAKQGPCWAVSVLGREADAALLGLIRYRPTYNDIETAELGSRDFATAVFLSHGQGDPTAPRR